MKKTIVVLVVACTMLANFSAGSLVSAPIIQAQAQDSSVIGSVVSTLISTFISIIGGGKNYKAEEEVGSRDCRDELVYYYRMVQNADGTYAKLYVGRKEVKNGRVLSDPPAYYDFAESQYYTPRTGKARVVCTGESTTTPCTPRALTCEEQNP